MKAQIAKFVKKPHVEIDLEWINKETAAEILENNFEGQRAIGDRYIRKYVADMKMGNWKFTGAPITFDKNGKLIDGQHRLTAVIKADYEGWFIVVRGVDSDAFEKTDKGNPRTLQSVLSMNNWENQKSAAAIIKAIVTFYIRGNFNTSNQPLNIDDMCLRFVEEPNMKQKIMEAHRAGKRVGRILGGYSQFGAMYHLISEHIDKDMADYFIDCLATGTNLSDGDPLLTLRQRFMEHKSNKNRFLDRTIYNAYLFIAFNKWVTGQPLHQLRWRAAGPAAQHFPVLHLEDFDKDEFIKNHPYLKAVRY